MTGRVKVIKRRSVSTGQMRRGAGLEGAELMGPAAGVSPSAISPSSTGGAPLSGGELAAVAVAGPAPAVSPPASGPEQPIPRRDGSAQVEVTKVGPESMELRVRCACGCETVIELNHPAEGVA